MSHTLYQRIIKSKAAFPIVGAVALALWLAGVHWPLDTPSPLVGWWGSMVCAAWMQEGACLLLCLLSVFLLAGLNNACLAGRHSSLHASFFMLLWAAFPSFSHSVGGNVFLVFLIGILSLLFGCYQLSYPMGRVFFLFASVGLAGLVEAAVVWLVPLLYAALYVFRALSLRSFCAGVLGLALPCWVFFTYTFCADRMELFTAWSASFGELFSWDYSGCPLSEILLAGLMVLLFLYGIGYVVMAGRGYKIRTRLFLLFLVWWSFFGLMLWALFPVAWNRMVAVPVLGISLLSGHVFMNTSTRMSGIFFMLVWLLLLGLAVYNCVWIL